MNSWKRRLGPRQVALLSRCKKKGFSTGSDALIVFNLPDTSNGHKRAKAHLEILEAKKMVHHVERSDPPRWELTKLGEQTIHLAMGDLE